MTNYMQLVATNRDLLTDISVESPWKMLALAKAAPNDSPLRKLMRYPYFWIEQARTRFGRNLATDWKLDVRHRRQTYPSFSYRNTAPPDFNEAIQEALQEDCKVWRHRFIAYAIMNDVLRGEDRMATLVRPGSSDVKFEFNNRDTVTVTRSGTPEGEEITPDGALLSRIYELIAKKYAWKSNDRVRDEYTVRAPTYMETAREWLTGATPDLGVLSRRGVASVRSAYPAAADERSAPSGYIWHAHIKE